MARLEVIGIRVSEIERQCIGMGTALEGELVGSWLRRVAVEAATTRIRAASAAERDDSKAAT